MCPLWVCPWRLSKISLGAHILAHIVGSLVRAILKSFYLKAILLEPSCGPWGRLVLALGANRGEVEPHMWSSFHVALTVSMEHPTRHAVLHRVAAASVEWRVFIFFTSDTVHSLGWLRATECLSFSCFLRAGKSKKKNNKLNFLWPIHAPLGPLFDPKNPPENVCVGPFLRPFPGNEAHKLFFWGPKLGCFGCGFLLKMFMCLFGPPIKP